MGTPRESPAKAEPECCRQTGYIYPDGGKRCTRHTTATDKKLLAELDRSARPILGKLGWPYGADLDIAARRRLVTWATERHVILARSTCQQLHWLRTGRCAQGLCDRLGRWMDHVTHWRANGGPALILAQPYGISNDAITQLGELAATDDVTLQIDGKHWYGYSTIGIEIWRTDAYTARWS